MVKDRTGPGTFRERQRRADNRQLTRPVVWFAQWVTEAKRHGQRPRRPYPHRDLADQRNRHRGDPPPFHFAGQQSHGLGAHGSHRNEESQVNLVLAEDVGHLGPGLFDEPPRGQDRSIEADVPGGHGPNDPGTG